MPASLRSKSNSFFFAACGLAILTLTPLTDAQSLSPAQPATEPLDRITLIAKPKLSFQFKEIDDKSLAVLEGDKTVLVYNYGDIDFKQGRRNRTRSSYVHPIYGLDGEVLTDDYPADHYHHHGLFWCWPHVKVGDREYDFWERDDIDINFKSWLAKEANADGARLGIENAWFVRDKEVMKEEAWLTIHPATADGRSIDVTLTWTPTDEPITLSGAEGKSYGGLSLRFAPRKDTIITVPTGRAEPGLADHPLAVGRSVGPIQRRARTERRRRVRQPRPPRLPARMDDPRLRPPGRRLARRQSTDLSGRKADHLPLPHLDTPRRPRRRRDPEAV